jgi:hypothetical protein
MADECRGMNDELIRNLVALYTSNLKPKSCDDPLSRKLNKILHNLEAAFTSNAPPEIGKASLVSATNRNGFSIPVQYEECNTQMTSLCTNQAMCEASASRYVPPSPSCGLRRRFCGTRPDHSTREM